MLCSILEKSTEITIYKNMYYDFVTSCIICPASSNHIPATSSEPVRSAGSVFWAFLTHQSLVIEWWWWSCQDGISPYFSLILCKHLRLQLPQEHAEFWFWKHSLKAWKTVWNILCSLLDWLEPAQCHGSCLSYACSLQTCQVLIRSWWSDAVMLIKMPLGNLISAKDLCSPQSFIASSLAVGCLRPFGRMCRWEWWQGLGQTEALFLYRRTIWMRLLRCNT